jgi:hypothetical protein
VGTLLHPLQRIEVVSVIREADVLVVPSECSNSVIKADVGGAAAQFTDLK